ncbi:MAG: hypothetical protein LBS43_09590 [Prevotellaceae bacterium]|jgi:hypothetical protein|nr:hypothetical protein [Prevotellaceae bacterium]
MMTENGLTAYTDELKEIRDGRYLEAKEIVAQMKQETAQMKQETAQIKQEIRQGLIEMEQKIVKLIPKGADYAKTHFLSEIKGFVESFEREGYGCDEKTLAFLEEIGISTKNLPRKKK